MTQPTLTSAGKTLAKKLLVKQISVPVITQAISDFFEGNTRITGMDCLGTYVSAAQWTAACALVGVTEKTDPTGVVVVGRAYDQTMRHIISQPPPPPVATQEVKDFFGGNTRWVGEAYLDKYITAVEWDDACTYCGVQNQDNIQI